MILSRFTRNKKKAPEATASDKKSSEKRKIPELSQYLDQRDYAGAISLLSFQKHDEKSDDDSIPLWLAYCAFHAGDYKFAADQYELLTKNKNCPPEISIYLACCLFYLGQYEEAKTIVEKAEKGTKSPLGNRLSFHLAHKLGDEKQLMAYHSNLQDTLEDNLCLASIHYMRTHYQEAIDIYKKLVLKHRNLIALNVYLALCYYKLDYYDVSLEVLQAYLQKHPDSATAVNLRACNHYKLYSGKSAEAELRVLDEQATPQFKFARDLMDHNMVVFRGGDRALQVLPPLIDVFPEARLNLVIYHLRQGDIDAAYALVDDLEPVATNEVILKAIVHCLIGQQNNEKEHLKMAQEYYRMIGSNTTECDTIPGRQCMASAFFLMRHFEEVLVYLNSVKTYFYNDATFNYNYGQACAFVGNYSDAEEALSLINDGQMVADQTYLFTLARCYIMNRKARLAWELYLQSEANADNFTLLQLIANDCYKMGAFYYAAKAFDILERNDANPEYWEGKRGACVGTFQLVVAGREPNDTLRDVIAMLQSTSHPQVDHITRIIKTWARENRVNL